MFRSVESRQYFNCKRERRKLFPYWAITEEVLRGHLKRATRYDVMFRPWSSGRKHTSPSSAGRRLHLMKAEHAQNIFDAVRSDMLRSLYPAAVSYESKFYENTTFCGNATSLYRQSSHNHKSNCSCSIPCFYYFFELLGRLSSVSHGPKRYTCPRSCFDVRRIPWNWR